MRFEKWQALGNDYVILESRGLPLGAHRAADQADLRPAFRRRRRRRAAALAAAERRDTSRSSGSSTPTGRRPSCRGTGRARPCSTCARRGWTDADTFSVITKAGVVTPTITGRDTVSMAIGRASVTLARLPVRGPRTAPARSSRRSGVALSARERRQPPVRDRGGRRGRGARPGGDRAGDRVEQLFPNRTNVSFIRVDGSTVRARIFERGVGETLSSGTGASGAAVAAFLGGARAR